SLAVEVGDPAPLRRPDANLTDVADGDRRAVLAPEDHLLQVGCALEVSAPANEVLGAGDLQHAPTDVVVRAANSFGHLHQGDAEALETEGVEAHLVLLGEPSGAGDL